MASEPTTVGLTVRSRRSRKLLQQAGYQTAIVGKWHLKSTPTGFDHFEVLKGQGQYYNPLLLTNGESVKHTGYTTDVITDQTLKWLDQRDRTKPFFPDVSAQSSAWQVGASVATSGRI